MADHVHEAGHACQHHPVKVGGHSDVKEGNADAQAVADAVSC